MAATHKRFVDQARHAAGNWCRARRYESSHCSECESQIEPFDNVCPECGQGNPSRISPWVAVYLVIAVALLSLLLTFASRAF